jgi:hypothetical protein
MFAVGGERICGCSSMVEPQPSKLMVWVRFPSPAPALLEQCGDGSKWIARVAVKCAHVAQSVEHVLGKDEVTGSNPVVGSSLRINEEFERKSFSSDLSLKSLITF